MLAKVKNVIDDNLELIAVILFLLAVGGWMVGRNTAAGEDIMKKMVVNQNQAKKITQITSGLVESEGKIAVRFAEPQIAKRYVGKRLENQGIFRFTPQLTGEVYWPDVRTVVFAPKERLTAAQSYTGVINLTNLFPYLDQVAPAQKGLEFSTLGQQLLNVEGSFELSEDNQNQARLQAELKLAEPASKEAVQAAVELLGAKEIELEVTAEDSYNFNLVSDYIERSQQDQDFSLLINNQDLKLHQKFKKEYILPALGPLRVVNIEEQKVDEQSQINIIFSDYLAKNLDYEAYLTVKPAVNYEVQVSGRRLTLAGRFKPEQKYRIKLFKGIKGKLGSELLTTKSIDLTVKISDLKPKLRFAQSGIFLTTAKEQKIALQTMNVRRVTAKVKKITADNLIEFLERNSYRPGKNSYREYEERSFQWAGEVIDVKSLKIGEEKNKWITSQLDLSAAVKDSKPGLYIVQLEFAEDDTLYLPPEWNDYRCRSYVTNNGRKTKHIILSNLGITAHRTKDKTYVFVTNILTAKPVADAVVKLKNDSDTQTGGNHPAENDRDNYDDYKHQAEVIESGVTDQNGICVLDKQADYLEVKKGGQLSVLKFGATKLDTSLFATSGINNQQGLKAFIYTDRGVYRPGDQVNLSVIVRNEQNTLPTNHPVTLKVYNPQRKLVTEKISRQAEDGFYSFQFATKDTALTGDWKVEVEVGGQSFFKELKIESIVPYRLEVDIDPTKEKLTLNDNQVDFAIAAEYLFGAPAAGLDSKTKIKVEAYPVQFSKFNSFTFTNPGQQFNSLESKEFTKQLNQQGKTNISWKLPEIKAVPSALRVNIDSKVLEKGGRPVPARKQIPIEVYDRYVGIRKLEDKGREIGSQVKFDLALVDKEGNLIAGEKLNYKIYRMRRYWWWEYEDRASFRRHFKNDTYTEVIDQGILTSRKDLATLDYELNDYGELFLEVEDTAGGHKAGYFFRSYWWGDSGPTKSADLVTLKADKAEYYPGETAHIAVNTPKTGRALLVIEKNGELVVKKWQQITAEKTIFEVPIKPEYIPNAYAYIAVYQPQEKQNDLPIRMYGIKRLTVKKKDAELKYKLTAPEEIEPKEEFTVQVATEDKQPSQFTMAVVDEGLLGITNFKTPHPLDYFFQPERLLTKTYDTFSDIIGLNSGYIYNVFSVGGGMSKEYKEKQLQAEQTDRFKPVALFKGPIKTDAQGRAEVKFKLPNYIGNLRVMIIGANKGRYGQAKVNIPVKSEVMLMPTLPRVLGPQDKIKVPVTVFGMADDLSQVEVTMKVEGPVEVIGDQAKELEFAGPANKELEFNLQAKPGIGQAEIKFKAVGRGTKQPQVKYRSEKVIDLAVRPYNPYIYKSSNRVIGSSEQVSFTVPEVGIANSNYAQLSLTKRRNLNLNHRLKWLIRYPYGCIEQTTSSLFPQLYLAGLLPLEKDRVEEIDNNLNAGIKRLRKFQLSSGGFSYWPNGNRANFWGTNYAGHFLLEAKAKGYSVPHNMLSDWLEYQTDQSKAKAGSRLTRVYRLYLLALADQPLVSEMNYLRENELAEMETTAQYFLAGAYKLAGYQEPAQELIAGLDWKVDAYQETGGTYGSSLRDKAVILEIMTLFDQYKAGLELYSEIAEQLAKEDWYSTQTTAYSLLASSKFLTALEKTDQQIAVEVVLPDGATKQITTTEQIAELPLTDSYGQQITVQNQTDRPLFAALEWEGIPGRDKIKPEANNLDLEVTWLDKDGQEIDPTKLKQGATFWGHFEVNKLVSESINELALVQILPAGWEIENLRLSGAGLPDWMDDYNLDNEEYMDIRDDRIRWFFDLARHEANYEFVVKINTVTAGEFYLPPTLVEAMYNNDYKATTAGRRVEVLSR